MTNNYKSSKNNHNEYENVVELEVGDRNDKSIELAKDKDIKLTEDSFISLQEDIEGMKSNKADNLAKVPVLNTQSTEKDVLKFWEENKIYEKVKKKNAKGKKFYFLQGPPYTSGKIHIGHAWNNALKDIILRYKRMQGFNVWDRAGYDMHGLPTENKVQQKLGFKHKEDIEKFGVDKFVKECIEFSTTHAEYMNKDLWNIGVWMDYKNAYHPISKEYMEGEWGLFKKAWEQGRLYKGKKAMHWDAQSETSLAKHELEYKMIKDTSIFLKFKKKNSKNEYFIIWTTTPWTIPFNLAIMVNPEVDYIKVKVENEFWWVAKVLSGAFISSLLGKKFEIVEECKGKKLEGQEYENPLYEELKAIYDSIKKDSPNTHTIILSSEYVDTSSGSGLVHCAPGCGPEDFEVGKKYGLPAFNTLNEQGRFVDTGVFSGWGAKEHDKRFIEFLEKKGAVLAKTEVEHEYPHSWRSHKPVVFRPTEQWFLKIEDLIPKLLEFNKKVHWEPQKAGESYRRWTENLRDNGITRQRFWGCPAPIWTCECNHVEVIENEKELSKKAGKDLSKIDLHKPWIDEVKLNCPKCKNKMSRIPDVIDVWIDSGTAGWNCLYNDPKLIKEYFPADLVLEATEQTKLWFNMLQICSAIYLGKSAYKNVFVHGMISDYQGQKMSKSLGNVISPEEVLTKYSADVLRYYMCQTTAGEHITFNWEDIKTKQRNLTILTNLSNYIHDLESLKLEKGTQGAEEKWIISRYNSTLKRVTQLFEEFKIDEVIGEIESLYLILSRGYIQLVRDKANENDSVLNTVREIYLGILKIFSTVCPFITEKIYQEFNQREESVHLSSWPKADTKKIDEKLETSFAELTKVIEIGMAERDKAKIGLRWPLAKATITSKISIGKELQSIVQRQLNVKSLKIVDGKELKVELDTTLTPELEAEGFARELARKVQSERKKAELVKTQIITLFISCDTEMMGMLKQNIHFVSERTNAKEVNFIDDKSHKVPIAFEVKGKKVLFSFS